MNGLNLLIKSIFAPFRSIGFLIKHPRYLNYFLLLIFLNILVFSLLLLFITRFLGDIYADFILRLQLNLAPALFIFGQLLIFIIVFAILVLLFNVFSNIISAPIYGHLAESIADEMNINYKVPRSQKNQEWVDFKNSLNFQSKRLLATLIIFLITLPLNFIPIIGQMGFFLLNPLQIIIFTGIDFFDPVLAREGLGFRKKVGFVLTRIYLWPFLLITGLLASIPVVNLITIPLGIISAILIYTDIKPDGQLD